MNHQTITLVLANGRRLVYTGQEQIKTGDDIKIVNVLFTEGKPLPPGCTWDTIPQGPPDLFSDLPRGLKTAEFAEAWHEWQEYRKERKKKLTPRTIKMQLFKLADYGSDGAVASIKRSIENGWAGLFDPPEVAQLFNGLAAFASKEDDHEP